MSDDVKRRRYTSPRRDEQSALTRERVLDAAAALFEERGFEGASIAAVATRAGVSEETVYARFRNKRTLLGDLVERAVRGPDSRPVTEQDGPRSLAGVTDQREQLRLFAADVARRLERAAPIVAVVSGASRSDPVLAELLERLHADRRQNLRFLVDAVAANGALRVPESEAVQTVWALTSPELHELLVRVGGWSRRRYREWLVDSLDALLLERT